MLSVNRTLLRLTMGGVGLGMVYASPGTRAPAGVTLIVQLDGGNAYVFSDVNKRVDVGAVKRPPHAAATDFNSHQMRLTLLRGIVVDGPDSLPSQLDSVHRPFWGLQGFEVRICPGGTCPDASALTSSPAKTPVAQCDAAQDAASPNGLVDNFYYVPNLLELHPGSTLKADWQDRLESRLVLRAGRLTVARAVGCFTFSGNGPAAGRVQSIAHGDAGVQYELATNDQFIDFVFRSANTPERRVRVRPRDGEHEISLGVLTGTYGPPAVAGQPVPHFSPFYELLDLGVSVVVNGVTVPSQTRRPLDLIYTPVGGGAKHDVSPGGECPPVRIGGPTN